MPRESFWLMETCALKDDRKVRDMRRARSGRSLRKSQHQVHRLNRLPGGTFYQIVEGRDGHEPAGPLIGIHTDVAIVRPFDVAGIGHNVFREPDETIVFIERRARVRPRAAGVSSSGNTLC